MKRIYVIGLIALMFSACSITGKMHSKTINNKLINDLLEENGNAFFINSTYIIISYIWTYNESSIVIYKLKKGKVINVEAISINEKPDWIYSPPKDNYFELDACMELDGDMFGYWVKDGKNIYQKDYPVNLECLRKGTYKSNFINNAVDDINKYQIKW